MRSRYADRPADLAPQTLTDLLNADESSPGNGARRRRPRRAMTQRRAT
jgi:hypothetical protein